MARGRKPRALAPDERQLWERVAASAQPIRPSPKSPPSPPPNTPKLPSSAEFDQLDSLPDLTSLPRPTAPKVTFDLRGPEARPIARGEAGLDRRTAERMRKGNRAPDARIDLHGMTAERAHRACVSFLANAQRQNHRMVLVITGKGREDGGEGGGILRRALPGWLRASPLGHSIVGIYQAHARHGGAGAYYVYLKKRR